MPPKKKGGKKKKKSGGKKSGSKRSGDDVDVTEAMDELNKEYFVLHIQDLERRLARYQMKYDLLEQANSNFLKKYEDESKEKKTQVTNLKKSLEQKGDELADLNDRLDALQKAKESQKDQKETELQRLRAEFQETKDKLTSENNILSAKYAALEEFRLQKDAMWQEYNDLVQSLESLKEEHNFKMEKIDNKTQLDRDRLKKEMVTRVNQVAAEFRKQSNRQMADTTKRTIRENVSIQTQLSKMADKIAELVQENEDIKSNIRHTKSQIKTIEINQNKLAAKTNSSKKILEMLAERKDNQNEILAEYELREKEIESKMEQMVHLKEEKERLEDAIQLHSKENEELKDFEEAMDDQLVVVNSELETTKLSLGQAAVTLSQVLQAVIPVPSLEPKHSALEQGKSSLKSAAVSQRGKVSDSGPVADMTVLLESLIGLLQTRDTAQSRQSSSSLSDVSASSTNRKVTKESHKPRDIRCTSEWQIPGAFQSSPVGRQANGLRKQSLPSSVLPPPPSIEDAQEGWGKKKGYCVPGSLQLVPPWGSHIPTTLEKQNFQRRVDHSSAVENEDWSTKNIASQTTSIPRALFFSDKPQ